MTSAEMSGARAAGARATSSVLIGSGRRNVDRRTSFYPEPAAWNLSKSAPIDIPGVKKRERDRQQDREQAASRAEAERVSSIRGAFEMTLTSTPPLPSRDVPSPRNPPDRPRAWIPKFARMRLNEMDLRMSYSRSRSENGGVPLSAASSTRSWNSDIADDPCDYGDPSYIAYTYDYEMRRARYGAHLLGDRAEVGDDEEGDEDEDEEEGDRSQRRAGALEEEEQEDEDEEDEEDAGRRDDSGTGDDLDLVFNIELH